MGRGVLPLVDDSLDIMLPSYRSPGRSLRSLLRRLWLMCLQTRLNKYCSYTKSMRNYLQGRVEVSRYQSDSYSNVLSLYLRLGFLLLQSRGMFTQLGFDNEVVLLRNRLVRRFAIKVLVSFIVPVGRIDRFRSSNQIDIQVFGVVVLLEGFSRF